MASTLTSTREEIVTAVYNTLNGLSYFKSVERILPTYEELTGIAETQFPALRMVAGLPVPEEHFSERGRGREADRIISRLDIELFVFLFGTDDADTEISTALSTIWVALMSDQTQGNQVFETTLDPDPNVEFWQPYSAFKVTVTMRYAHTKGAI